MTTYKYTKFNYSLNELTLLKKCVRAYRQDTTGIQSHGKTFLSTE